MTASPTIQENPVNLSHLLRNTCPLFLLLVLLMETKQFNFVCANVPLWRGVARKKKKISLREKPATPFQICWCYCEKDLGTFWWGKSQRSVEGFYVVSSIAGERGFILIKRGSLVFRWGGLSPKKHLWAFAGSSVSNPDVGSAEEALLPPESGFWSPYCCFTEQYKSACEE